MTTKAAQRWSCVFLPCASTRARLKTEFSRTCAGLSAPSCPLLISSKPIWDWCETWWKDEFLKTFPARVFSLPFSSRKLLPGGAGPDHGRRHHDYRPAGSPGDDIGQAGISIFPHQFFAIDQDQHEDQHEG